MAEKYAIINSIINISFFIRRIRPMQPEVKNKKLLSLWSISLFINMIEFDVDAKDDKLLASITSTKQTGIISYQDDP